MGTRSLTVIMDEGKEVCCLYRQMDGHPNSHGKELAEFLKSKTLVNGISGDRTTVFNGMGCLAAQVVSHFKGDSAGDFYLYPPGTRDCGEEFIYTVSCTKKPDFGVTGQLNLKVQAGAMTMFGLPGTKQKNMPVLFDGPLHTYDGDTVMGIKKALPTPIPNDFAEKAMHKKLNTKKKRIAAFVNSNPRVKVNH
jgi:hypothetical protein